MPGSRSPHALVRSLEATLRFAQASGAWIVPGAPFRFGGESIAGIPSDPGKITPESAASATEPKISAGPEPIPSSAELLTRVREELGDCHRCRLSENRTHIVFGVGDPEARLMLVGEGPGEEEDRKGEPFVGRAGRLLDRMIFALGLERKDVYIANVIKCRPPRNRDPLPDEAATCLPFLWGQIDAIRPRVICALGAHAARNLLGAGAAIGSLRGKSQRARGWTVLPTYHPAYLLRNPVAKRLAWRDLKTVKRLLEEQS